MDETCLMKIHNPGMSCRIVIMAISDNVASVIIGHSEQADESRRQEA